MLIFSIKQKKKLKIPCFRSNSLSRVLHSSKNYNSSQSFHLTTNLPDLKHLTLNELSFKQFSTNSEITNLEKKYNEITKRGTTNAYLIYINQNRKIFAEKNPGKLNVYFFLIRSLRDTYSNNLCRHPSMLTPLDSPSLLVPVLFSRRDRKKCCISTYQKQCLNFLQV